MGRLPSPSRNVSSIPLQSLQGRHFEIMRRKLAGETNKKIAHDLNMAESRISIIINSPLFVKQYKILEAQVQERFINNQADIRTKVASMQMPAIDFLGAVLKEKEINGQKVSLGLKHDVALDILELGGNSKKKVEEKGSAISDVIKIISEGFELAKASLAQKTQVAQAAAEKSLHTVNDIEFEDVTHELGSETTLDENSFPTSIELESQLVQLTSSPSA